MIKVRKRPDEGEGGSQEDNWEIRGASAQCPSLPADLEEQQGGQYGCPNMSEGKSSRR